MSPSRHANDFPPTGDETDSTSDADLDSLSDDIDDDTDDEAWLFDDEIHHPPEHYLAEAASGSS
jgi:hypothetical protein